MAATPLADLEAFALDLPGAFADMPWDGDVVAKVGKKIFVFFGSGDPADDHRQAPRLGGPRAGDARRRARPRTGSAGTAGSRYPSARPMPRPTCCRTGSRRATGRSRRSASSPSSTPAADRPSADTSSAGSRWAAPPDPIAVRLAGARSTSRLARSAEATHEVGADVGQLVGPAAGSTIWVTPSSRAARCGRRASGPGRRPAAA